MVLNRVTEPSVRRTHCSLKAHSFCVTLLESFVPLLQSESNKLNSLGEKIKRSSECRRKATNINSTLSGQSNIKS